MNVTGTVTETATETTISIVADGQHYEMTERVPPFASAGRLASSASFLTRITWGIETVWMLASRTDGVTILEILDETATEEADENAELEGTEAPESVEIEISAGLAARVDAYAAEHDMDRADAIEWLLSKAIDD